MSKTVRKHLQPKQHSIRLSTVIARHPQHNPKPVKQTRNNERVALRKEYR